MDVLAEHKLVQKIRGSLKDDDLKNFDLLMSQMRFLRVMAHDLNHACSSAKEYAAINPLIR